MKQLIIIISLVFTLLFLNVQGLFAQTEPDNRDTIENVLRNVFIKAVDAALSNDTEAYHAFFTEDVIAITEKGTFKGAEAMDVIIRPALQYYKNETIQVVKNIFPKVGIFSTTQSIEIITIHTDTAHGIPIGNYGRKPKHMSMELKWTKEDDKWLIRQFNRDLWRLNR